MSDSKIPTFDGTPHLLDEYIREVTLWSLSTNLRADQRGPALVLRLTDRAKVISQTMNIEELNQDRGVDYLIEFLRTNLRITNMHYVFDVFRSFINMKRNTEHVDMYISEFYQFYMKLVQVNIRLPEPVVTLLIIENARLSDRERSLVDSIMLSQPQNAFSIDTAIQALRQILREKDHARPDAFLAEEVLTDIECFSDDPSDSEFAFEINYVRKKGQFFRRIPKRYKSQYFAYRPRRKGDSSKGSYKGSRKPWYSASSPSWNPSHSTSSYTNTGTGYYSQGKKGASSQKDKGKGKGKGKYGDRVYVVESETGEQIVNPPESSSSNDPGPHSFPTNSESYEYDYWEEWN